MTVAMTAPQQAFDELEERLGKLNFLLDAVPGELSGRAQLEVARAVLLAARLNALVFAPHLGKGPVGPVDP